MATGATAGRRSAIRRAWPAAAVVLAAAVAVMLVAIPSPRSADPPMPPATPGPFPESMRALAQLRDDVLAHDGWTILRSGSDYLKPSEDSPCDELPCIAYRIRSTDGCSAGFAVEAAVETNGVVVGYAHANSEALEPDGHTLVVLRDYTGLGSRFQLVGARCLDRG